MSHIRSGHSVRRLPSTDLLSLKPVLKLDKIFCAGTLLGLCSWTHLLTSSCASTSSEFTWKQRKVWSIIPCWWRERHAEWASAESKINQMERNVGSTEGLKYMQKILIWRTFKFSSYEEEQLCWKCTSQIKCFLHWILHCCKPFFTFNNSTLTLKVQCIVVLAKSVSQNIFI